MHVYFSGIGGAGIGPLAEIAHDAGYTVSGSDAQEGPMVQQLRSRGMNITTQQDGSYIRDLHFKHAIEWFVYSSALPDDHPELAFVRNRGIYASKRHELLAHIIDQQSLSLVAVAGTHGKTTTTAMMVWLCQQLGVPASYSVGATLSFGPSGHHHPESQFFFYECDEYDRNFLYFHPYLSVLTSVDYDHPDTYKTPEAYKEAFGRFAHQSQSVLGWPDVMEYLGLRPSGTIRTPEPGIADAVRLHGAHNRANAALACQTIHNLTGEPLERLQTLIADFPGTSRRFEKLADNLYSDYGHHPVEIAAVLEQARELSDHVVLVYQPHQNLRQHEMKDQYTDCTVLAERIYWLPTYLTREDSGLEELTPETLIENLHNKDKVVHAELNDSLWQALQRERWHGKLVLIMGAGDIDAWARNQLKS